jgi:hypothetical protein
MQTREEYKEPFQILGSLLEEMQEYLAVAEQGCAKIPELLHGEDKALPLQQLTQLMEGMNWYQKLLQSAIALLEISSDTFLYEQISANKMAEDICRVLSGIYEAARNQDYSLTADLVEYDLRDAVILSQKVLAAIAERYQERVMNDDEHATRAAGK